MVHYHAKSCCPINPAFFCEQLHTNEYFDVKFGTDLTNSTTNLWKKNFSFEYLGKFKFKIHLSIWSQ